ncbi:MAG: DUF4125 family protein [Proteobacteria bacterium]|nr:DUF4125 family protein [Pseudomonadota bacterium]
MEEAKKNEVINKILEIELAMFLSVPVLEKANCQEHPDQFRSVRQAQFLTWSEQTLNSYLNDLKLSAIEGRNLMTQKYARIDNLVPEINNDPLIEKIVTVQTVWQREMLSKYPNLMRGARAIESSEDSASQTSFQTYLRSELETYSHDTLTSLHDDIANRQNGQKSITEELYERMVKDLGYESLEEAEETLANQAR